MVDQLIDWSIDLWTCMTRLVIARLLSLQGVLNRSWHEELHSWDCGSGQRSGSAVFVPTKQSQHSCWNRCRRTGADGWLRQAAKSAMFVGLRCLPVRHSTASRHSSSLPRTGTCCGARHAPATSSLGLLSASRHNCLLFCGVKSRLVLLLGRALFVFLKF